MKPTAADDARRRFALDVLMRLREAGFTAYWAGGCVRDLLLDKVPKDYDVATDARPEAVQRLFGYRETHAVGASFGVILVAGPQRIGDVEVATFRSEGPYLDGRRPEHVVFCTPEEDALRRDFTINGMFYDPLAERVLDYVGGQQDLRDKLVRAIGDPHARFGEDKLRMLRAVRFAAALEFELDRPTAAAVRAMSPEIHVVSAERIAQELKRMFESPHRMRALEFTRDTGLLAEIFPELRPVIDSAETRGDFAPWNGQLKLVHALAGASFELILAALFHDVSHIDGERITEVCRRLRLANRSTEQIAWLTIHRHALRDARRMPLSKLKRLLVSEHNRDLLALMRAECAAKGADPEAVEFCEAYLRDTPAAEIDPPLLLTGDDLIREGFVPGPRFRDWLDAIRDAQLEGRIQTPDEALALAAQLRNSGAAQ